MSAQMSSGAGGDGKKPEQEKCAKCGYRHQGPCLPSCRTCGKVHKGVCRYANPVPSIGAVQEPSQNGMAARYQAQQAGQRLGYQQAYSEIRSLGMGPMMGPMGPMGLIGPMAPMMGPAMGGFDSPYAVPHGGYGSFGGFGAMGNPGWAVQAWRNQIPAQFGQGQGGFPALSMGQVVAASDVGTSHGASVRHSARGARRGSRGGRTQSGRSKDKEEKGPLAATNAGIVIPVSKNANNRARRKAKKQAQDALAGPADPRLLDLLSEPQVTDAGDIVLDDARPLAEAEEDLAVVDADGMINEALQNPVGFELLRQARLERMACLLEHFDQDSVLGLSESAATNGTSTMEGQRSTLVGVRLRILGGMAHMLVYVVRRSWNNGAKRLYLKGCQIGVVAYRASLKNIFHRLPMLC